MEVSAICLSNFALVLTCSYSHKLTSQASGEFPENRFSFFSFFSKILSDFVHAWDACVKFQFICTRASLAE